MTIEEATRLFVRELNAIPGGVVEKLMGDDYCGISEVTPPTLYNRVTVYNEEHNCESGEIVKTCCDGEDDLYAIKLDNNDEELILSADEFEVEYYGGLPMWSTMWAFSDSVDNWWLENGGFQKMADCGFRIYEQEDYEYIFGIDGAGYDFYEEHWIPLYKARGLHWHNE